MKNIIKLFFSKIGFTILSNKNDIFKKVIVTNAFDDQMRLFSKDNELVIFDVGAQYGQTATEYCQRFRNAKIYSFEPFLESFNVLQDSIKNESNLQAFNIGMGETAGKKQFNSNSFSATNSILETDESAVSTWGDNLLETIEKTEINITTIDSFSAQHQIKRIDILKIDVQGYEYNVIEGARNLLLNNAISVIYLEIIILPTYKNQKQFDEILSLLRSNNFSLYNLYNFSYDSSGFLRQVDATFVSNAYKKVLTK